MTTSEPTVFVVDDDKMVRRSLCWLISSVKLPVQEFASAHEFLETVQPNQAGCVIIDVRMPGMSGLELQQELATRSFDLPVIMISGHGDQEVAARAIVSGAVAYIEKPFDDEEVLDLVRKAIEHCRQSTGKST